MHLLVVFFAVIFFRTVFAETIPEWAKALASLVQTMNATLNSHLETIESRLGSLEFRLGSVESGIIEVKSQIVHGFQSMHTFGRRRVEAIKQASNNFYIPEYCQGAVTRHTVVYNNRVGELFTPHILCNSSIISIGSNRSIFVDDFLDIGVIGGCPSTTHGLDISIAAEPFLGDQVITYGFGDMAKAWSGTISDKEDSNTTCLAFAQHWTGVGNICAGEYLVQGEQHKGLSGAAVLNGCGYIGIAHAVFA